MMPTPDGKFGAMMEVSLCNDVSRSDNPVQLVSTIFFQQGPVTITIDSKAKSPSTAPSTAGTPTASGTSTPSPATASKSQLSLAEKKAKRANAARAYAEKRQTESGGQFESTARSTPEGTQ